MFVHCRHKNNHPLRDQFNQSKYEIGWASVSIANTIVKYDLYSLSLQMKRDEIIGCNEAYTTVILLSMCVYCQEVMYKQTDSTDIIRPILRPMLVLIVWTMVHLHRYFSSIEMLNVRVNI